MSTGRPPVEGDELAAEWLQLDKNPVTRAEIEQLLKDGNKSELLVRLASRMTFGTAGLRARMGAGYSRMNDLTVIQTTQGFTCYLKSQFGEDVCKSQGVIIGYDARHNSHRFAQLAATIFINSGFKVYLFSSFTPTPFTPFGVLKYKCVAGIMITASHNPKDDNGYKVYWSNGAQIIPPHDRGIAHSIEQNLNPWPTSWDTSILQSSPSLTDPLEDVQQGYYSSLVGLCYRKEANACTSLRITYTPVHGVGQKFVEKAFKLFRLPDFFSVTKQMDPDPDFPTVKYPNPEEGVSALDLAIETANSKGCSVIIANDPDVDRMAVAEKHPTTGTWRVFSGNETGFLLAWWALKNYRESVAHFDGDNIYMLASTVSSKLLHSMATVEGFHFEETLTGFKWMGNRSHSLLQEGKKVLFAYEEAIGFMLGTAVLDKDGVSAAAVMGELASWLYDSGRTLGELLNDVYLKYGRFLSDNSYYLCHSSSTITSLFESLRKDKKYPSKCGSASVVGVRDLTIGYDSTRLPDCKPALPTDSNSQLITFLLDNRCVFTLRTSGTEPKIKYYIEVSSPVGQNVPEEELRSSLKEMTQCVVRDFLRPEHFGLVARSV